MNTILLSDELSMRMKPKRRTADLHFKEEIRNDCFRFDFKILNRALFSRNYILIKFHNSKKKSSALDFCLEF